MLTENEVSGIPHEPEAGLAKLIELLFEKYIYGNSDYSDRRKVAEYVSAYCNEYKIYDGLISVPLDWNSFKSEFWPNFEAQCTAIHAKSIFRARKLAKLETEI